MATTPEQTISGFDKTLEIPGLEEVMQPQKQRKIQLTRCVLPMGQTLLPTVHPGTAQHLPCCLMQAMLDRRDQRIRLVEQSHRIKVENQIIRTGSPDADRMHPRIPQTEEIYEHDRMQVRC